MTRDNGFRIDAWMKQTGNTSDAMITKYSDNTRHNPNDGAKKAAYSST